MARNPFSVVQVFGERPPRDRFSRHADVYDLRASKEIAEVKFALMLTGNAPETAREWVHAATNRIA